MRKVFCRRVSDGRPMIVGSDVMRESEGEGRVRKVVKKESEISGRLRSERAADVALEFGALAVAVSGRGTQGKSGLGAQWSGGNVPSAMFSGVS